MRKTIAVASGAAAAAFLTHGLVYSALDVSERLPLSTYRGFFQGILFTMLDGWKAAGFGEIESFGRFYAAFVLILTPLVGFTVFALADHLKPSVRLWKPAAALVLLAVPLPYGLTPAHVATSWIGADPWSAVLSTMLVLAAMFWSVGAVPLRSRRA